ncbi:MAG: FmdB family zinc ribbon protein [Desulfitobacteriaceae bacterium]
MPIYEFKCSDCGQPVSKLCRLGETGDNLCCANCGHSGLNRLISGFASPGVAGGKNCSSNCGGSCSSCHA